MKPALVVVGASLGGLHALRTVLAALPAGFALPVAVVQHRTADAGDALKLVLQDRCALPVREATDKMSIEPGRVYLAPAGYHLLVDADHFALSTEEPLLLARPSIDLLFETAAQACGAGTVAVVLTGTGHDGAAGVVAVQRAGGRVVVEMPASATAGEMPQAAKAAAPGVLLLELAAIGPYLAGLDRGG